MQSGYATQHDGCMRCDRQDRARDGAVPRARSRTRWRAHRLIAMVRLAVGAPPGRGAKVWRASPEPMLARSGQLETRSNARVCFVMRLGLAYPIDGDGTPVTDHSDRLLYAGSFAMAVDGSGIDELMTERASSGQAELPPIEELMGVWLCCADHVGLSVRRAPFVPADDFRPVLQALVRSGYAWFKRDGRFVWTDKIGLGHAVAILLGCRKSRLRGDARTTDRCGAARRREIDPGRRPAHGDRGRRSQASIWRCAAAGSAANGQPEPDGPVEGFGGLNRAERFIELVLNSAEGAEDD